MSNCRELSFVKHKSFYTYKVRIREWEWDVERERDLMCSYVASCRMPWAKNIFIFHRFFQEENVYAKIELNT